MTLVSRMLSLVKFEHTVFALPFAYAGMALAARSANISVTVSMVIWITVAMVGARTMAMAFNRLADARIDARNPRTRTREIPSGALSWQSVAVLCAVSLAVLVLATTQLDPLTRLLWPLPVALFVIYPYTKRFTWLCHLFLGASIGLAPVGAWIAVTGSAGVTSVALAAAIATWIAGFDIFYATADIDVDRAEGLHSIPARFGIRRALAITRALHVATVGCLVWAGLSAQLGISYAIAVLAVAVLLSYENSIVKHDDLSRLNAAFFTTNGVIGIVFLVGVLVDGALT